MVNKKAQEAAEAFEAAQGKLYDASKAWVQDPTDENQEAFDAAKDAANEATANSRRLHGGSQ